MRDKEKAQAIVAENQDLIRAWRELGANGGRWRLEELELLDHS
jgi:hypothetical protein